MNRPEVVRAGCFSDGHSQVAAALDSQGHARRPRSLQELLGDAAWTRLPEAVRRRFADAAPAADYSGEFEVVRANALGRAIAWACQVIGTPVAPRTGTGVPALVHVAPCGCGVEWRREYRWPGRPPSLVRSTKVIDEEGRLIEKLPAGLCMSLDVYEAARTLHFVSRGYYFELPIRPFRRRVRMALPRWLSPGITHVEHIDQAAGWFRFTMTVTHPLFGEVFYQTGRFRAARG